MTLDELIEQKRKEKIKEELSNIVSKKLESKQESTDTSKNSSVSSRRKAYNASESTNAITNNTSKIAKELPVANEFRQQLETGKRVQPKEEYSLPTFTDNVKKNAVPMIAKNVASNVMDEVGYVAKKTGAGVLSGTTGIAEAGTTDIANNIEKGKEKSINEVTSNILNSFMGIMNPVGTFNNAIVNLPKLWGNTINTFKDKDKNVIEKIVSNVTNSASEALNNNSAKNIINSTTQAIGKMLPENTSEKILKASDAISAPSKKLNEQLEIERNNHSLPTQVLGDTGQAVGNMVPSILATAVTKNPSIGLATMGLSVKGQATQEALDKGATLDQAVKIGDTKAMVEVGTEMLTGGVNIFGKGALDKIVEKGIDKKVKNEVLNYIIKKGLDIPGEIVEETIADVLGTVIDKGTIDPNAKYTWEDFGNTAVTTTLSTLVLNALTGGYSKNAYNANRMQLQETQDIMNDIQNEPVNTQTQQITSQENKIVQNQTSGQLNDILNNKELPMQSYQYEKSDNAKINNLRQDANKYFNNSENARNYVNMLEKIITDKNIDIRLDANLKTADGRIANGSYSNGVITINPNSTRTGEFITIHELTHAIGTDSMKNIIETYRKSNAEFDTAVEKLLQNYNSTEITEEALSDISAQLFGNQEFINNIAQNNPNIFQKLYSEIKYIWHQFRGYKNQDQFIEDLYYKWTQAYNSNNKLNNSENYLITQNSKGKYVKADRQVITGNNPLEWENQVENYINDTIRQGKDVQVTTENGDILTITKDTSGKAKFRNQITDKNGNTRYLNNKEFLSKLIAETHIDELAQISEKINKNPIPDYKNHKFAKDGFDYRSAYFEDFDGQYYKITMSVGKNGNIDTIYNIGKMDKKNRSKSSLVAQRPSDKNITSNEELTSINSIPSSNENVNTTKYSIQESENNSGSFSMQDNQGRTLTKEQQEYFKDSKVRDENGNLKTMYHGSNNKFTIFKHGEAYKGSSKASVGYWFTETTKGAENFANSVWYGDTKTGAKVYEVYLNIKNPKIYNGIDNTNELHKIDNNINNLKETIRKLENKNIAIEINKQDLRWANSKEELRDIAKYEGIDFEDAENYHNAIKQYDELIEEYDNKKYNDSYELFRADIYKIAGKSANEANIGGTGMYLSNEEEVVKQYVEGLKKQGYDGIIIKNTKFDNETLGKDNSQYVVFEPNQIKNVSNINPTDNPDIRYSQNNQTWQSYLDKNYKATGTRTNLQDIKLPTKEYFENKEKLELLSDADYEVLNKIYEKEGKTEILTEKKKAKLLEKFANDKYTFKDSIDILAQKFVNKGHYIDKLAEEANNQELKFLYDRNLNSFAEGQYVVGVAQTDNNGNKIGKSINDIWKPVEESKLSKEFSEYMLHKLNIDRSEKNKFVFGKEIGPAESTQIALNLEKQHPEFKQWAKEIKTFNHNNLINLKEAGLITQDTIDYLETMYPNYIPISRDIEDKLYAGSNDKTGTSAPIKKAVGGNSDIQPLKDTMAMQAIRIKKLINQNKLGQELAKTLKNAKVEDATEISLTPSALLEIDTLTETDAKGNKYYTYFENGKLQKLKINDNLYKSLKPTEISELENTLPLKIVQKVNNVHRNLLTSSNPLFVVTNFFKDFQDGMFNSKYSSKFIKNYGKALNEILIKGKYYESYMANGGMTNSYFDYNEGVKKKSNKFVEKIRSVNEIVEQLPRLSEFISTLEDGKSLNEALYNAAEITTNFKRGGDIAKAINRNGANFFNASIQGLDKFYRNFSGKNGAKGYANLLIKATLMGVVPSALNHMLLDDDEDYQDLPQSTKDLYYLFKYDDGKFIRIPKGRVLSIFGAISRRSIEAVQGQDDAFDGLGETIANQIAPNNPLEDNILAPIAQAVSNKTWYGGDLVSSRLQKELPKNQYDETTDEFSKWLGEKLNLSPKKINYVIDQYIGGIGDVLLPMITPQAKQNIVVDKFTTDSVLKNKNVSKFYETLEKQTQIANDTFATDEDILQLKYLNSVSKDMSDLYKEKRKTQMSSISNKEKTEKVRSIQNEIDKLAEKGLENYRGVTVDGITAKTKFTSYYKNGEGEWQELTEEEKEKNKNISLKTYADYKNKIYNLRQEKIKKREITKKQDLKDKDKIQILLNSNYSNKEISAIYENYILSSTDKTYSYIKASGIDVKQYLKYKQQEFTSDKKDDGTIDGKSINGSKQQKMINYLNSMNISGNQRLFLYAINGYNTTSSQKSQLVEYVNKLNLNKTDKLKLYNKFSGFTVYKDGTIKY